MQNYLFKTDYTEKEMQMSIIDNFDKFFPNYSFVKREYTTKSNGKIDILAKDNITNRDVIIELKLHNKNPNRQLLDYANDFDNPILIGITQEKLSSKSRRNNIIYYTFNKDKMEINIVN